MDTIAPTSSISAALLQISEQRAAIAAKKADLEKQDSQLASLWNTYQPISRLSADILVEIFTECALDGNTLTVAWTGLRLVCRRWDEVACGTPSLWRTIDVRTNNHWLTLCLTRSVEATLDITIHILSRNLDLEDSIFRHAARIRSLTVCSSYGSHTSQERFRHLLQLFDFHMPALETVVVMGPLLEASELHLSHRRHPVVQRLSLQHVCRPVDLRLLSHLRSLELSKCHQAFRMGEFLDALASSFRLEELRLRNFLQGIIDGLHPLSTSSRKPITLSRLLHLGIADYNTLMISMFVSHICLPANAKIYLSGYIDFLDEDGAAGSFLGDTLSDFLPPPASRSAFAPLISSPTLTTVSLSILFSCFRIEAHDVARGSSLSLTIDYTGGELEDGPMRLSQGVSDLVDILSAAPLKHLSIAGIEHHTTADVWDRLLTSFPTLESLSISAAESQSSVLSFWIALGRFGGHNAAGPELGAVAIRCPALSRLVLEGGLPQSRELFLHMVDCLARRGEGGTWLEYLQLGNVLYGPSGQEERIEVARDVSDMSGLRLLVDELVIG